MRPQRPISEQAKVSLKELLEKTETKADFKRVLSVWLRASLGLSSEQVALGINLSPATVRKNWSQYFTQGEKALLGEGRGGRRRANLSLEEESALLADFLPKAKDGRVLAVNEVKIAYEEMVGHSVPKSTIYRLLARHGWRKVAPRPRHPKFDPRQMEDFKKNSSNRP